MKSNPPPQVAADPDGAGAGVRRHQTVLRRPAPSRPKPARQPLTPEEMKALGIAGDTPRDTVATLVAQVKQLRNELQTALNDNKNQKPRTSACARGKARSTSASSPRWTASATAWSRTTGGQRPAADPGPAARSAAASGRPFPARRPVRPARRAGAGRRRRPGLQPPAPQQTARAGSSRRRQGRRQNGSNGGLNFPRASGPAQKRFRHGRQRGITSPTSAAARWARPRSRSTPCRRTRRSWARLP